MSAGHKERYHQLYEVQPDKRLYAAPWWLDATCGNDGWDACFSESEGTTLALPYCAQRIRGLAAMITPPLTQWVDILHQGTAPSSYSSLFSNLPDRPILDISVKPGIDLLPLPSSLRISSQYSYVLPPATNAAKAIAGYNDSLRYSLKLAPENFSIKREVDIQLLVQLYAAVFRQKSMKPPWWIASVLPRLIRAVLNRGQGEMRFARDRDKVIAGSLIVWDDSHDYYLVGGRDAGEGGMSAHAFLLHDAIVSAGARNHDFDFEGSMVAGIASFFQSFGAKPVPYTRIRRFRGMGRLWSMVQ